MEDKKNKVFDKHYNDYLKKISSISFSDISGRLGADFSDECLKIKILNSEYTVSKDFIKNSSGERPSYEICIILFKYLMMCPESEPNEDNWISFRNFRDSGPLINYFSNNVENHVCECFSGKIDILKEASGALGGVEPAMELNYDFKALFYFLPKMPMILLFNDEDEEFPPISSVLFEKRAESYLDAECLAMAGYRLAHELKRFLK